jgi:type IV secretory pathway VirB2 component (pilin)
MYSRLRALRAKANPLAIYCALSAFLATSAPAFASQSAGATTTDTAINLDGVTGSLGTIINLATGNVAKLIAIACILGGAAGMAQGREGHEALKNLGIVAFTIGLLICVTNIMSAVGAVA